MFKLVVLSVCVALAAGTPSGILETQSVSVAHTPIVKNALFSEPTTVQVQQPYVAKVGEIVRSEPSAVSSQYQTIVHNRVASVEPILAKGVQTVAAPAVRTYEAPVVAGYASTPIVKSVQYAAAPAVVSSYAAPSVVSSYAAPSVVSSYAAPSLVKSYAAPGLLSAYAAPASLYGGINYAAPALRSYGAAYGTLGAPLLQGYNAPLLRSW